MFTSTTVLMFDPSVPARSEDLAQLVRRDPTVREAVIHERTGGRELRVLNGYIAEDPGEKILAAGPVGDVVGVVSGPTVTSSSELTQDASTELRLPVNQPLPTKEPR